MSTLDEIRARWEAATPLGWPWDDDTVYLASQHPPKVHAIAHAPEDIATLLAEVERLNDLERRDAFRVAFLEGRERIAELEAQVERLTDGPDVSLATGRPHPAVLKLRETRRQRDEALGQAQRVTALVDAAEERSPIGVAHDRLHPDEPASVLIPTRDLRAALAPVAPDAEPGESRD